MLASIDPFRSNRPYIKEQYVDHIINHRPQSSCDSLYYAYVQSPLCDWIVTHLPAWLAPNLVTVFGFAWNMAALFMCWYLYGNSTEGYFDPYLSIFCGIAFFIYTTADNCDGKQARRNGTGSVMGMLFDHGLDAVTAVIVNMTLARMVSVGPGLAAILVIQCSTVPFYFLIMEEYYIGMLNLPMGTGPDDTSLIIIAICFFSAYCGGGEWWQEQVDIPFELGQYIGYGETMNRSAFAIFVIYCIEITGVVLGSVNKYWRARNESHFKERFTWQSFLAHGGYMALTMLIYDFYGLVCGSKILYTHTRSIGFCFAGQFLHGVLRMLLANASGENFNPYRRTTLIAWGLMGINIMAFIIQGEALIDEKWMFRGINTMIWSAIAHFSYYVIDELKTILGIRCFHVIPKVANPQESSTPTKPVKSQSKKVDSKKKTK